MEKNLILAINPGSTSTKIAVYDGETELVTKTVRHPAEELAKCGRIPEQQELRVKYVLEMLDENNFKIGEFSAIAGRGGIVRPIQSGVYSINDRMKSDLNSDRAAVHTSALGGLIAAEIGEKHGIPAYIVDPVVVDEMEDVARLSGIPGIDRYSVFHALNTKSVCRMCAADLGIEYENGHFIAAHMGGGITVGAHRYGRVVDVSNAVAGEGPFTPQRCGAVPLDGLIDMCFAGTHTKAEVRDLLSKNGGMLAYIGTDDMIKAEEMIDGGDQKAALVVEAMAYQVSKEIGAMAAVLEGRIDAIVLTGGIAHSERFTGMIKNRVSCFAPVMISPGEGEMLALAVGAFRAIQGKAQVLEY